MVIICYGDKMKTICIIGAGPSGLFCAHKILSEYCSKASKEVFRIVIIEKGEKPSARSCPGAVDGVCRKCESCAILSGGGGAGLFSDGKIIQDLNVGGHNDTVFALSPEEKDEYISYITQTLVSFDGVSTYKEKPCEEIQENFNRRFSSVDLNAKYYSVLHMGSSNLAHILEGFIGELTKASSVDIKYGTTVTRIAHLENKYNVYSNDNLICTADYVVMAVGKSGASWLKETLLPLGVHFNETGYYFGLRIEVPQRYLSSLATLSFDPKIYRKVDVERKVKMHCFCRKGNVIMTNYEDCVVAGGHSPFTENNPPFNEEEYGNFNVLLSYPKTSDYKTLLERFKSAANNSLMVQTLGDFKANKAPETQNNPAYDRINQSQAGNIRTTMNDEFFSEAFLAFIHSLDRIFPGVGDDNNLLYGPAFEWCMDTVGVSKHMETNIPNLFAIGDGAGLSQGIMYSASTGIIAAKCIIERMNSDET